MKGIMKSYIRCVIIKLDYLISPTEKNERFAILALSTDNPSDFPSKPISHKRVILLPSLYCKI